MNPGCELDNWTVARREIWQQLVHVVLCAVLHTEVNSRIRAILTAAVAQQPCGSSQVQWVLPPRLHLAAMSSADVVTPPDRIRRAHPSPPEAGDVCTPPRVNKRKRPRISPDRLPDMAEASTTAMTPPRPTLRGLPLTPPDAAAGSQNHSSATQQQKPAASKTSSGKSQRC